MASEKYIIIPGTQQKVYDGTVVMLHRLPNIRWIIHNGYYTYNGRKQKGWYLSSIPSDTTMPVFNEDLVAMTIIDKPEPGPHPPHPPFPPIPPGPLPPMPIPFTPIDKKQLEEATLTVANIEERDKLSSDKLPNGKVVKVVDSDGEGNLEYYSWNAETSFWEPASFGYRYMTREEIEVATADDIVSIIWSHDEGALVLGRQQGEDQKVQLTGVAHDPSFLAEDLELRIPIYGGEDLVIHIPHDMYMRSIRYENEYHFPDGTVGPAIVVVVSDGQTETEIAGDASGLVDIYTGSQTDTATVTVLTEDGEIKADIRISTREENRILIDEDGIYVDVSDLEERISKLETNPPSPPPGDEEGGIVVSTPDGLVRTPATIGGDTIDMSSTTNLAKESAVVKIMSWSPFG